MSNIREELDRKLDNLSPKQLKSVSQFIEFLEHKQQSMRIEEPITNEDIDRLVVSYRRENKPLPIGLAKGEFTVPDDFNAPLPDEILALFNNPE